MSPWTKAKRGSSSNSAQVLAVAGVGEGVEHGHLVVGGRQHVAHVVRADEPGAAGDEAVVMSWLLRAVRCAGADVRPPHAARSPSAAGWPGRAPRGSGSAETPVGVDRRVVPRHAQLVGGVVVAVHQVGDRHVGERGEAVGHTRRDVHAEVVVRPAVDLARGRASGWRRRSALALAQVVQHHPGVTEGHVPVVGLVQVVVQARRGSPATRLPRLPWIISRPPGIHSRR